jgi:hypothetical protein
MSDTSDDWLAKWNERAGARVGDFYVTKAGKRYRFSRGVDKDQFEVVDAIAPAGTFSLGHDGNVTYSGDSFGHPRILTSSVVEESERVNAPVQLPSGGVAHRAVPCFQREMTEGLSHLRTNLTERLECLISRN